MPWYIDHGEIICQGHENCPGSNFESKVVPYLSLSNCHHFARTSGHECLADTWIIFEFHTRLQHFVSWLRFCQVQGCCHGGVGMYACKQDLANPSLLSLHQSLSGLGATSAICSVQALLSEPGPLPQTNSPRKQIFGHCSTTPQLASRALDDLLSLCIIARYH